MIITMDAGKLLHWPQCKNSPLAVMIEHHGEPHELPVNAKDSRNPATPFMQGGRSSDLSRQCAFPPCGSDMMHGLSACRSQSGIPYGDGLILNAAKVRRDLQQRVLFRIRTGFPFKDRQHESAFLTVMRCKNIKKRREAE